ncbi:hypothetical protein MTY_2598 [Moorella thermoacetica Y72]|uniref:Uncharacterized protein n=1 Tax=Moorella thermoacetica Y72 TaxID=1325331 RepID=A0A0S6UI72_NEOTH|nr:hypothetical protein [Moorella thermoacetica]GAF27257.1 hypothetical protein MTY_2598 [Moorella thermoacetica Y72]
MAGKNDILLLTSSYGGGHRQAALALGEALTICAPISTIRWLILLRNGARP